MPTKCNAGGFGLVVATSLVNKNFFLLLNFYPVTVDLADRARTFFSGVFF